MNKVKKWWEKNLTRIAAYIIIAMSIITTIINSKVNREVELIISMFVMIFLLIVFIFIAYINKALEKKDKALFVVTTIIVLSGLIYIAI